MIRLSAYFDFAAFFAAIFFDYYAADIFTIARHAAIIAELLSAPLLILRFHFFFSLRLFLSFAIFGQLRDYFRHFHAISAAISAAATR